MRILKIIWYDIYKKCFFLADNTEKFNELDYEHWNGKIWKKFFLNTETFLQ